MFFNYSIYNSDIPVGLLHLIPLGLAKHLVKYIVDSVDNNTLKKMSAHLDAVVPGGRFFEFFKYMQSRQGKDFKYYVSNVLVLFCFFLGMGGWKGLYICHRISMTIYLC